MRTIVGVRGGGRLTLLAFVLGGLLVGLVGMHHIAVSGAATSHVATSHVATSHAAVHDVPSQPGSDEGGHGSAFLHLCFAIMAASAALTVVLLLWGRPFGAAVVASADVVRERSTPRAPPPTAPQRLALLCVSRT